MESEIKSVQEIIDELIDKLGFDFNRPYHTPQQIKTKLKMSDQGFRDETLTFIASLRKGMSRTIALKDSEGKRFRYCLTHEIEEYLHHIDMEFKDYFSRPIGKGDEKTQVIQLLKESMVEEPYYSCAINGEICKLRRAKDIISKDQEAKDLPELIVLNYYNTLDYIFVNKKLSLDKKMLLSLHEKLCHGTLNEKDSPYIGRLRKRDDISVRDKESGEELYHPPTHKIINKMLKDLILWLNKRHPFTHPVIKASIAHFYLSHIHPFVDGNGRVARSLFYKELLESYDVLRYLSISDIINQHKDHYYRAFQNVTENGNDLTYFILFSVKALYRALMSFRDRMSGDFWWSVVEKRIEKENLRLNKRQIKLLRGMARKDYVKISVESAQKVTRVVYKTARKDLNELVDLKLLTKKKTGRKHYYFQQR